MPVRGTVVEVPRGMLAAVAMAIGLGFALVLVVHISTALVAMPASAATTSSDVIDVSGEIDYFHTNTTVVWESPNDATRIFSPLLCVDIDGDGADEIVFGVSRGRLAIVEPLDPSANIMLEFPPSWFYGLEVGNVDDDPSMEILFIEGNESTLICVDYATLRVQWRYVAAGDVDHFFLVDGGDGKQDVFVIAGGRYERLCDGLAVYNGTLDVFNVTLGNNYGHLVHDLDDDGRDEILVIDRGYNWLWGSRGRHLWIIDPETGVLEYSRDHTGVIFNSDPRVVSWGGRTSIVIGLLPQYSGSTEIFVMAVDGGEYSAYDVTSSNLFSGSISLMAMDTGWGPVLIFSTANGGNLAWHFPSKEALWETASTGGSLCAFLCDIDGDSERELVRDPLTAIDAMTGTLEGRMGGSVSMAIGDLDADGLSEICYMTRFREGHSGEMDRLIALDSPPYFNYTISVIEGPTILYAGLTSELTVKVEGMVESKMPDEMDIVISNKVTGPLLATRVDMLRRMVTPAQSGGMSITSGRVVTSMDGPSIELQLLPDWKFSFEGPNDIDLIFHDWKGRLQDCVATSAFRVERDLVVVGELRMRTMGGPITPDTWVAGDTNVVIDGFDVVYEGTTDIRPERDAFTIIARVGDVELERSFTEEWPIGVALTVPRVSGQVPILISVNMTSAGVRSGYALATSVNVDCWPPMVFEPAELRTWYSSAPITAVVRLSEPEAGMNHWGLRYTVVKSRDEEPTRWFVPYEDEFGVVDGTMGGHGTHWVRLRLYPPDGLSYLLVEATDAVGNSRCHLLTVRLDITAPRVTVEAPTDWCTTDRVKVTAHFEDIDGSGIDPDSVQVAFAYADPPLFADWVPARASGLGERVNASAFIPAVQGKLNHAKFRARDYMNHVVYSDHVTVWVDSIPPDLTLQAPLDGTILDPPWEDLKWRLVLHEAGSGLGSITVRLLELGRDVELEGELTVEPRAFGYFEVTVGWAPAKGTGCRLDVKVTDMAGNVFVSPLWAVHLNTPPEVRILTPRDNSLVAEGTTVLFDADVWDRQTRTANLTCQWSLDGLPWVWGVGTFENASLPVGTHCVRLEVSDGFFTVGANVTITVFEPPEPPEAVVEDEPPEETTAPARSSDAIIVAACLAAIVALFVFRRHKRF